MLEFSPSVSNVLIILSTSMSSSSLSLRSVSNVLIILSTSMSSSLSLPIALVMFSLFCPLPCIRGVLEFAPVSNVLIILFHVFVECSSFSNVLIILACLRGVLEFDPSVSNVLIILSTSMSSGSAQVFL